MLIKKIFQSNIAFLAIFCVLLVFAAVAGQAQQSPVQSPILTIDTDMLYSESLYGRETTREIEALGADLAAENRLIEEDLIEEERALTEQRAGMDPLEFRALADAFDEKVQEIRREQDAKTRELNRLLDERQVAFLNAAAPVLEQLMREAGAAVILERRSIFLSANAIDITQTAIDRLNAAGITIPDMAEP
ncbi:MAG: OmpH family outer membrane protein [Pseudomonadota bacterium]